MLRYEFFRDFGIRLGDAVSDFPPAIDALFLYGQYGSLHVYPNAIGCEYWSTVRRNNILFRIGMPLLVDDRADLYIREDDAVWLISICRE